MSSDQPATTLAPLNISCGMTKCDDGLHCFKQKRRRANQSVTSGGACKECGTELVNWERLSNRDFSDITHTVQSLKNEFIRHHFWHEEFTPEAINYARRKGTQGLRLASEQRIRKSVGPAQEKLPFDGRQTPTKDIKNPIFSAQHAMACCCRKCIEYWHGIPRERELTELEVKYLSDLIMHYLEQRFPGLPMLGEKVPAIRKKSSQVSIEKGEASDSH